MDAEKVARVIKNIYTASLGCKENERLLIFTDKSWLEKSPQNNVIFDLCKASASNLGLVVTEHVYDGEKRHGAEPPESLWEAAFGKPFLSSLDFSQVVNKRLDFQQILEYKDAVEVENLPDVVVAMSYYSTSHTNFRKTLNALGVRYASMPGVEEEMFYSSLDIDFNQLEQETLKKMSEIEGCSCVLITSPSGTDLYLNFAGRKVHPDTGNLSSKGSFGNLPAGEVYLAPNETKTEGRFVVLYAMNKKLEKPLKIFVEKGRVVRLEGDSDLKGYLENIFKLHPNNNVIAELGVGTNRKAANVFNTLEAEKIYSTCHVAIGDNSTFGGENRATVHIDFVIFEPTMRWS